MPHDTHSAENDLDEVLAAIGMGGIDVLKGQRTLSTSYIDEKFQKKVEASEDVELDLTQAFWKRATIRCASICARWA